MGFPVGAEYYNTLGLVFSQEGRTEVLKEGRQRAVRTHDFPNVAHLGEEPGVDERGRTMTEEERWDFVGRRWQLFESLPPLRGALGKTPHSIHSR